MNHKDPKGAAHLARLQIQAKALLGFYRGPEASDLFRACEALLSITLESKAWEATKAVEDLCEAMPAFLARQDRFFEELRVLPSAKAIGPTGEA